MSQRRQDDLDHIIGLLDKETHQDIRQLLDAAKHRIRSGTIREAITALTDLHVMHKGDARIDPLILVPDDSHHDRFIHCVDRARGPTTTMPQASSSEPRSTWPTRWSTSC